MPRSGTSNANEALWAYFKSSPDKFATCNLCKKKLSYKTTITNLKQHLLRVHTPTYTNLYGDRNTLALGAASTSLGSTGDAAERSEDFTNKLLQAVEKHPELYQGGSSADEKDQHWIEIATELGEGARYCKEEWRCLRKLYQSYSKGNQEEATSEMEEQMEQMSFLAPFIEQETFSDTEPEDLENETDEGDPLDNKSFVFENVTTPARKQPLPAKRSRVESKKEAIDETPLPAKKSRVESNNEAIDETPKKLFLLSLMPDVRQMNNEQMRKFKKRVLDLIDDILNE